MTSSYFPQKKLASDWLISYVSHSEANFLAENSLTSYFHFKSKSTMPLVVSVKQNPNFKIQIMVGKA